MTRKPAPWDPPVSRWLGALNRWLKSWTWWEMGMYISATRIWPPTPMGMPSRSLHRNRRPRSRTKLLVPRTPVASQADPKKPAHRPSRVETMYQVGGSLSLAMALERAELAVDGGGDGHEDPGQDLAGQKAEGGEERATSRPTSGCPVPPRRPAARRGTRRRPVGRQSGRVPTGRRGEPAGWRGPPGRRRGRWRWGPSPGAGLSRGVLPVACGPLAPSTRCRQPRWGPRPVRTARSPCHDTDRSRPRGGGPPDGVGRCVKRGPVRIA